MIKCSIILIGAVYMEWIERINSAINYIEENICEPINIEEVSKIASCSSYHFQRMFAYMTDVPLTEYIRRRKYGPTYGLKNLGFNLAICNI